jgi:dihydroorotate dehydrogenase (NAD+) catalytic subunit
MLAGATAVQIGTYNFIDPEIPVKVIDGIDDYCNRHGFKSSNELVGMLTL